MIDRLFLLRFHLYNLEFENNKTQQFPQLQRHGRRGIEGVLIYVVLDEVILKDDAENAPQYVCWGR